MQIVEAKDTLDSLIQKQRVALYKPIQIAEILFRVRSGELSIEDVHDNLGKYRNPSKRWRDEVTRKLINQVSTSSQRYQDNLFEPNATPPETIMVLAKHNREFSGVVERYIYQKFKERQGTILKLVELLNKAMRQDFHLEDFLLEFTRKAGIKRSIDKAYEIIVYALFDTLVKHLQITVTIQADKSRFDLLSEFEDFTRVVIGIDSQTISATVPAHLYRAGVTNAADKGLDIWANFGPAVQVKHLRLTEDLAEDVCKELPADRIVIVCQDCEEESISRICQQLSISTRIQGIVTERNLVEWYKRALGGRFASELGDDLLSNLRAEFHEEFPYSVTFDSFYSERGYNLIPKSSSIFWIKD